MSLKDQILLRIKFVIYIAGIFCVLIIGKIVHLQIFEHAKWSKLQGSKVLRTEEVWADRGNILSSDERILASSVPHFKMRIDFRAAGFNEELYIKNLDSLAYSLSHYLGNKSVGEYKAYLKNGLKSKSRAFPVVSTWIDYFQLDYLRNLPFLRESKYQTGVYFERKVEREKPFGMMAKRTIGEMDGDSKYGVYGLEQSFDAQLKGKKGTVIRKTISGKQIRVPVEKPKEGNDLLTTIDVTLQDVAENSLEVQLRKSNADHGCAILMEVETGNILAIANLTRSGDSYKELYNYAVGESSEPGSTFKLASFIAALEEGQLDIAKYSNTGNGVKNIRGATMTDSHDGGLGVISYKEVFTHSSNIGTSMLIDSIYRANPSKFIDRLYAMGLNEPSGIDIKGEPDPYISSPGKSTWSGISVPWISIGYEVKLTPLQILTFYNAIANNGKMIKPRIVKAIYHRGEKVKDIRPQVLHSSICSSKTVKIARGLMEAVVEEGTANNLRGAYLKIAGKTGTAQVSKGVLGYRSQGRTEYKASFCGYFPADNPTYSCIVVVTNPSRAGYYGNTVAGPVFREIADKVYSMQPELAEKNQKKTDTKPEFTVPVSLNGNLAYLKKVYDYLDVPYTVTNDTAQWVRTTTLGSSIQIEPVGMKKNLVPNVVGMGLMDAVFVLENAGLAVKVSGSGRVKNQSILPGVRIRPGLNIALILG